MPYTKLTLEIEKKVKKLSYVDSFYIHGSRGINRHSPTSDIDYMFLLKNQKEDEPKLRKELNDLVEFKKVRGWYPEQTWEVCCLKEKKQSFHDIGWHAATTAWMLDKFSKLFSAKEYFLQNQDNAQFMISEARAVYDQNGYVEKLKTMVSKYPQKLSNEIVADMVENLKVKLMWNGNIWIPRNKYSFINDIRDIIWFIAVAHYAKNKAFLMNSMKRWHHDMDHFKPNIKADLDNLLSIDKFFGKENKNPYLQRIIKKLEK